MTGIFYFSSTGNSLYIAQALQRRLGGQIKYIPAYDGDGGEFDKIIVVTPVHSFGLPVSVYNLLPLLNKRSQIIVVQNYGGMLGGADYFVYRYCLDCGLNAVAVYTMKMPENFTVTFTVPKSYIKSTLNKAEKRIENIIEKIETARYELPKKRKTKDKTYFANKASWHIIGKRFSVNENCTHCLKCVDICPVRNISFIEGKIVFADRCVACLGCYHRCPYKAITYLGKKKKDRYINPNVREEDIGKDLSFLYPSHRRKED